MVFPTNPSNPLAGVNITLPQTLPPPPPDGPHGHQLGVLWSLPDDPHAIVQKHLGNVTARDFVLALLRTPEGRNDLISNFVAPLAAYLCPDDEQAQLQASELIAHSCLGIPPEVSLLERLPSKATDVALALQALFRDASRDPDFVRDAQVPQARNDRSVNEEDVIFHHPRAALMVDLLILAMPGRPKGIKAAEVSIFRQFQTASGRANLFGSIRDIIYLEIAQHTIDKSRAADVAGVFVKICRGRFDCDRYSYLEEKAHPLLFRLATRLQDIILRKAPPELSLPTCSWEKEIPDNAKAYFCKLREGFSSVPKLEIAAQSSFGFRPSSAKTSGTGKQNDKLGPLGLPIFDLRPRQTPPRVGVTEARALANVSQDWRPRQTPSRVVRDAKASANVSQRYHTLATNLRQASELRASALLKKSLDNTGILSEQAIQQGWRPTEIENVYTCYYFDAKIGRHRHLFAQRLPTGRVQWMVEPHGVPGARRPEDEGGFKILVARDKGVVALQHKTLLTIPGDSGRDEIKAALLKYNTICTEMQVSPYLSLAKNGGEPIERRASWRLDDFQAQAKQLVQIQRDGIFLPDIKSANMIGWPDRRVNLCDVGEAVWEEQPLGLNTSSYLPLPYQLYYQTGEIPRADHIAAVGRRSLRMHYAFVTSVLETMMGIGVLNHKSRDVVDRLEIISDFIKLYIKPEHAPWIELMYVDPEAAAQQGNFPPIHDLFRWGEQLEGYKRELVKGYKREHVEERKSEHVEERERAQVEESEKLSADQSSETGSIAQIVGSRSATTEPYEAPRVLD